MHCLIIYPSLIGVILSHICDIWPFACLRLVYPQNVRSSNVRWFHVSVSLYSQTLKSNGVSRSRQDVNTPLVKRKWTCTVYSSILHWMSGCQMVNTGIFFLAFDTLYILLKSLKLHWYVLCTKQRRLLLSHFRIDKGVKSQSSHWQKTTHLALSKKAIVFVILPLRHNCLRERVLITDTISCSFSMETLGTSICLLGKPWVSLVYVHYTEKNRIDCVLTSVYC